MSTEEQLQEQQQPPPEPNLLEATKPPPMLPRSLHGSCHCSRITYTVDVELPFRPHRPVASRCNCRICLKLGFTNLQLPQGKDSFHLLTPSSLEDEGIVDYSNVNKDTEVHRYFCGKCGVTICGGGHYRMKPPPGDGEKDRDEAAKAEATVDAGETAGKDGEGAENENAVVFFSINLGTLDQPQEGLDLSVFRIEYWDGRNDNWMAGKKEVPWPGGIV